MYLLDFGSNGKFLFVVDPLCLFVFKDVSNYNMASLHLMCPCERYVKNNPNLKTHLSNVYMF